MVWGNTAHRLFSDFPCTGVLETTAAFAGLEPQHFVLFGPVNWQIANMVEFYAGQVERLLICNDYLNDGWR